MKPTRFVMVPRPTRGGLFRDLLGVGRGLWATAAHIVEKPAAQPPITTAPGSVNLRLSQEGTPLCVACGLCSAVCPSKCLSVQRAPDVSEPRLPLLKRFEIDELRCISCARCVEICPESALDMSGPLASAAPTRSRGVKRLFPL
jgi:NADH-quinone oxidoreductase subunit I